MTLEEFAQVHDLPPRWLELRQPCEEIVTSADFWYRPDLRQAAGELALEASNVYASVLEERVRKEPQLEDARVVEGKRERA